MVLCGSIGGGIVQRFVWMTPFSMPLVPYKMKFLSIIIYLILGTPYDSLRGCLIGKVVLVAVE